MFKFSERSKQRMDGVAQELIDVANLAIQITSIDFGIPEHGGKRTAEEQHQLFLNKASKADGYKYLSKHQSGDALDVYAYVDGKASWRLEHLALVAAAMLQAANRLGVELEWGGFWTTFPDSPHFQLRRK